MLSFIKIMGTGLMTVVLAVAIAHAAQYGDITFFVVSDLHYGYTGMTAANQATIDAMNNLPGTAFPSAIGGIVDAPRGVLVAGDLTDNGNDQSAWNQFVADYGLNGSARLQTPVYEGYGNHDWNTIVRNGIKSRNLQRTGVTNKSSNGYHYSWDWDQLHVVQCNLYAGDGPGMNGQGSPDSALTFLGSDLAKNVGASGRPVVIVQHYGWDDFSVNWWAASEKDAMYQVIKGYNIVGIFHGHCHCIDTAMWHGIPAFDDGSIKDNAPGNFLAVHISGSKMTVVNRQVSTGWQQSWVTTIQNPVSTRVAQRDTHPLEMTVDQKADVITLRGAPGTAARVFTMSGKAIGHITLNSRGIASIGLPGTGMYVIKGIRQGAERSSALATVILR